MNLILTTLAAVLLIAFGSYLTNKGVLSVECQPSLCAVHFPYWTSE